MKIVKDATAGSGRRGHRRRAGRRPAGQAVGLVRRRGTVCLFASLPAGQHMLSMDSRKIHYGELRVVGTSDSTPAHVAKAVELIATNKIPAAKIASHVLPLEDIFEAYRLMESGEALAWCSGRN